MTQARKTKKTSKPRTARKAKAGAPPPRLPLLRRVRRALLRLLGGAVLVFLMLVLALRWVDPPGGTYMWSEYRRLGWQDHVWTPIEDISLPMQLAVIAAEDARFCSHWGFDAQALRAALSSGAQVGASTISQQVTKNLFLWHGRSWPRKALEAMLTPVIEVTWPKRRILEVYLNIAEFGNGIFGVAAGARQSFGVSPQNITPDQAARLAVVLPNPKERFASELSMPHIRRAASVMDGAALLQRTGRAECILPPEAQQES